MDCSYWNEVKNQNTVSRRPCLMTTASFLSWVLNTLSWGWKVGRRESRGAGMGLTGSSGPTTLGSTLLTSGAWFAFAQSKIPYLLGFVWENSALWKLTTIFQWPWTTPVFLEVAYVVSHHISKNWIQILTFFPPWHSTLNNLSFSTFTVESFVGSFAMLHPKGKGTS